jgi:ribose/xylose/arabinose/galactoside ABC-type transport system permease subunit
MSAVVASSIKQGGPVRLPKVAMGRELILAVATLLVVGVVGALNHDFLGVQNLRFILLNSVVLSLVALGQTLVIAMRGIDLSVAPLLGLAAMVCGLLAQSHGLPLGYAVLLWCSARSMVCWWPR